LHCNKKLDYEVSVSSGSVPPTHDYLVPSSRHSIFAHSNFWCHSRCPMEAAFRYFSHRKKSQLHICTIGTVACHPSSS
jgi:hypothetical protein